MLLLDSATQHACIALSNHKNILDEVHLDGRKGLSEQLLPTINKLLQKHRIHPEDLKCIACGQGPGSYTGTRVGAMVAKALSYANQTPLLGFCSLEAWTPEEEGQFVNLIDAKVSGVYLSKGEKTKDGFSFQPPQVCSLENADPILREADFVLTTDFASLSKKFPSLRLIEAKPNGKHMIELIWNRWINKDYSLTSDLNLLYLRDI